MGTISEIKCKECGLVYVEAGITSGGCPLCKIPDRILCARCEDTIQSGTLCEDCKTGTLPPRSSVDEMDFALIRENAKLIEELSQKISQLEMKGVTDRESICQALMMINANTDALKEIVKELGGNIV